MEGGESIREGMCDCSEGRGRIKNIKPLELAK
jgi:hypothetical protein